MNGVFGVQVERATALRCPAGALEEPAVQPGGPVLAGSIS